jgi:hypothetical protein
VSGPENPPSFIVRTEAEKAAWDNGYRVPHGEREGWAEFGSTTAPGRIWIAAARVEGPWWLSFDHRSAGAELGAEASSFGPGAYTIEIPSAAAVHAAVDRLYRLSRSLPPVPLAAFKAETANLPQTTEAERLVVQRIGQDRFRQALLDYWSGRCPLTGITDERLLRASHIVPWSACRDDAHRLDVHNGLLLSALWDAAFDAGLISFTDEGASLISPQLSVAALATLGAEAVPPLPTLTEAHCINLRWHRQHVFR